MNRRTRYSPEVRERAVQSSTMATRALASRLHHLAAEVSDMDRSIKFYRELLGMRVSERHRANEVPAITVELTFLRLHDNHHDLVLSHDPKKDYEGTDISNSKPGTVGFHHFAFEFPSREAWLEQLNRTQQLGIEIIRGPLVHSPDAEGSWGENESFYVWDPDGHRVELFCNLGSIDQDGWILTADSVNTGRRVDEI